MWKPREPFVPASDIFTQERRERNYEIRSSSPTIYDELTDDLMDQQAFENLPNLMVGVGHY